MTPAEQADAVIAFYKRLTDATVPSDAALLLTIDFNKGLMAGHVKPPPIDPSEKRAAVVDAAETKRRERAERLGAA